MLHLIQLITSYLVAVLLVLPVHGSDLLSPISDLTSGLFHSSLVTDKVRKGRRDQPGWIGRAFDGVADLETLLETFGNTTAQTFTHIQTFD